MAPNLYSPVTQMVYRVPCDCGDSFDVTKGQAGTKVECDVCGRIHSIGSIRSLQSFPTLQRSRKIQSTKFQFSLAKLIAAFIPAALLAMFARAAGPSIAIPLFVVGFVYGVFVVSLALLLHYQQRIKATFWDWFGR